MENIPPVLLLIGRINDGVIIEVSSKLAPVLGYSREEFVGKNISDIGIFEKVAENEIVDKIEKREELSNFNARMNIKNKGYERFLISLHNATLFKQACFVISASQVTDKRKIEEELIRSRTLHREAQAIAHLGHWELDPVNDSLLWSDEIYKIFEIDPDETEPSYGTFLEMVHPEDRASIDKTYKDSVEKKTSYEATHRLLMSDGRIKYVRELGRTEYSAEGIPLSSIGTVQDITSLKEAELAENKALEQVRQSQKLEAIGTLAGGIAHDFNNILFAILGHATMALESIDLAPDAEHHLEHIVEASSRAESLIGQILTFCRKSKEERKPVIVKHIIEEVFSFLKATFPATITINQLLDSDSTILADATHIHQLIMNLSTNASHAMQEKGGVLSIALADIEVDEEVARGFLNMRPGRYLQLVVSDTGHGMDKKTRAHIFDPFFTTKENGKGTGLGLSVVHGIVEKHDGQIVVYSEPGIGTTFKIYFPIISADSTKSTESKMPIPGGTESIMVLDDEEVLANLMKEMLASLGYSVEALKSPYKALEIFRKDPLAFDLLITDMNMPEMSGIRTAKAFHRIREDMPIVICTGFTEQLFEDTIEKSGFRAIMKKPLMKRDIAIVVRRVLDADPYTSSDEDVSSFRNSS